MVIAENIKELSTWIIITCSLLLLGAVILGLAVMFYRRRWLNPDDGSSPAPWSLEDLRKLRDRGDVTEEEYQAMRAAIIGALRGEEQAPGGAGASDGTGDLERS